jgi:AraC-like DNA-binding protein
MPQLLPSDRSDSPCCAISKRETQRHHISSTFRIIVARSARLWFSFNGRGTTRESSFSFSARRVSRPKTFTHVLRHSSEMLGRENLHDEMRSGRPRINFLDIRILVLLTEQPVQSVYSIAEALGVSHSTILSRLRETFGMKFFHFCWIPYEQTTSLWQTRMETCWESLPILELHEKKKCQRFVTGDESWFTLEFRHSPKWNTSQDDVIQKVKQEIGA